MKTERVYVLGVPVDCVDMKEAIDAVHSMVSGNVACKIIALNPEKVIKAKQDEKLLRWLNSAELVIPDGIGVVIASRLLYKVKIDRVPGSELMPAICESSVSRGYKLFLYGASPTTVEKAVSKLKDKYKGIQIVGYQDGFLPEENMHILIDQINNSGANILFVALGSPKQELWMDKYLINLTNIRVCQGVGGTFDVIAGTVKRAPGFFINIHCEWLYRLLAQPKRILRQTALPIFAYRVLLELIYRKNH